jgi:prevent-host-death family protein
MLEHRTLSPRSVWSRQTSLADPLTAEAKTHLSHLLDQVEAGGEVVITRRGLSIARISPVEKPGHPVKSLAGFRRTLPRWRKSSADLLRTMRVEGL